MNTPPGDQETSHGDQQNGTDDMAASVGTPEAGNDLTLCFCLLRHSLVWISRVMITDIMTCKASHSHDVSKSKVQKTSSDRIA